MAISGHSTGNTERVETPKPDAKPMDETNHTVKFTSEGERKDYYEIPAQRKALTGKGRTYWKN